MDLIYYIFTSTGISQKKDVNVFLSSGKMALISISGLEIQIKSITVSSIVCPLLVSTECSDILPGLFHEVKRIKLIVIYVFYVSAHLPQLPNAHIIKLT